MDASTVIYDALAYLLLCGPLELPRDYLDEPVPDGLADAVGQMVVRLGWCSEAPYCCRHSFGSAIHEFRRWPAEGDWTRWPQLGQAQEACRINRMAYDYWRQQQEAFGGCGHYLGELDRRHEIWEAVRSLAWATEASKTTTLWYLYRLRELLGEEDYWAGQLPDPVP